MVFINILMLKTSCFYVMQDERILNGILYLNTDSWNSLKKLAYKLLYVIIHHIALSGILLNIDYLAKYIRQWRE